MRRTTALIPGSLCFILTLASACGGGTTASPDSGVINTPADSGPSDATIPDAGVCDPVLNTGCGANQGCVWVPSGGSEITNCRSLASPTIAHEMACSTQLQNCGGGFSCLQLQGDDSPKCYKVCQMGNGCDGLTGSSPNYTCQGLQGLSYGICRGTGVTCQPYEANDCPANQTCTLRTSQSYFCEAEGPVQRGGNCATQRCDHGLFCVPFEGEPNPICYQTCPPTNGTCPVATDACVPTGLPFAICETTCDPLMNNCPMNKTCERAPMNKLFCNFTGTSSVGESCATENCARGGMCAQLPGGQPLCYQPCDPMAVPTTCPLNFDCAELEGYNFGFCLP